MKLYLQNKLISIGDSSYVLDEAGKNFFQVNGKVVSPTRKKFLCDLQGNTLYMIRNKYWHFFTHSAFICDSNGQKIVKIKEKFFGGYTLSGGKDEYEIKGKFLEGLYIYKNKQPIGRIARKPDFVSIFIRDGYEVEIYTPADAALLTAFAVAYDNIQDQRKKD